ncbi:MAG: CBS domain-containing protein [Chloroflexota bacterium]
MSAFKELENEQVRHLDLSRYCQVESGTSVRDVLAIMRRERCRAVLVTESDRLAGIFTERDVLSKVVMEEGVLDGPVDAVMTANPIAITPDTSAAAALWLMDQNHFRNLPVVDGQGHIVGDMTHAAVITYLASRYPEEVLNRPPRPEQYPRKAEGG